MDHKQKRKAFDKAARYLIRARAPRAEMPLYCFGCGEPLLLGLEVESKDWEPCPNCGGLLCVDCCFHHG